MRLTYDAGESHTSYNNAWCVAAIGSNVHVVWFDYRDGNYEIYAKRSTDYGASWGADTRLTNNSASSYFPSVAASGTGVHVVWYDYRDGNYEIYAKRSTDYGASWGADTRLTYSSSYSEYPSVAASGSNVHVLWQDSRDGNNEIYAKRSTDYGATWGPDTRLTSDISRSWWPSVAASGSDVHVVWEDYRDGMTGEIYAKRSTDYGATWGPDTRLTNDSSWSEHPSVAASGSNVHVLWQDYRDGNWKIYAKRSMDYGATWGPDTRLTNDSLYSGRPSVAVSGSNVRVVWYDYRDGVNPEIYAMRSTDYGASWGPDTRLTNDSARSELSSVAASGSCVHVVWYDERDGNYEIYYKRDPTGNSGVEETAGIRGQGLGVRETAKPNPFSPFTTVPGHASERFALYDISGRKMGVYRGDRVGEGLSAGVYFLRPEGKDSKPLRIVKLR